ncbi:phage tail protein [Burkholderia multivorans]|nr:phage tail protein [Burkholderia multivorans]
MSVTAASSTATLNADEIIVGSSLGGQKYLLKQFSKTINLGTTGAGGMDTGSAPASGFVALYAIYNPTTGASALLATNATSTVAPNVYGGANMPSGYTASALVSVWGTNASGQLVTGSQNGRVIATGANLVLNSSTQQSSLTPLSISSVVPRNARTASGILTASSSTTSPLQLIVSGLSGIGQKGLSGTAISQGTSYERVPLMTPQTIYYVSTAPTGTPTFLIYVTGYEF